MLQQKQWQVKVYRNPQIKTKPFWWVAGGAPQSNDIFTPDHPDIELRTTSRKVQKISCAHLGPSKWALGAWETFLDDMYGKE